MFKGVKQITSTCKGIDGREEEQKIAVKGITVLWDRPCINSTTHANEWLQSGIKMKSMKSSP